MTNLSKFKPHDKNSLIDLGLHELPTKTKRKRKNPDGTSASIRYINVPMSYDIETSSFYDKDGQQTVITYSHAFNINGHLFLMRTWDEMVKFLHDLADVLQTHQQRRAIIYVHNLSYEFNFLKSHFEFADVFSNGSAGKILTATTTSGIEFRCSYMLSGQSLSNVAKNLTKHKISKLEEDFDYNLIRTPETPLTEEELGYIINDVDIIYYYILEMLDKADQNITKLPLTQTGYVRKYMRNSTLYSDSKEERDSYRSLMKKLTLEPDEYIALREAFSGGFTHANANYSMKVVENVTAYDYSSSYPARMVAKRFPMSKGEVYEPTSMQDFQDCIEKYCCLMYIEFDGLSTKVDANESYLPTSKALVSDALINNNGRIESANLLGMWLTDIDLRCALMSYDIEGLRCVKMYRYKPAYLPTTFIRSMLKLYADKTELKGIEEELDNYNLSKAMLNSTYGMTVQDVIQDEFEWNDDLKQQETIKPLLEEKILETNDRRSRFLFYPWGVWITAHARYDLFEVIHKLGENYVYADTDSIYVKDVDEVLHVFEEKNKLIEKELEEAMEWHKLDISLVRPKDIKGRERVLGVWDLDGEYTRFKTLGAKRYMVEEERDGEPVHNITVSGVNKSIALPYMREKYGVEGMFDAFNEGLFIPEGYCGKMTHTKIDTMREGVIRDYKGKSYRYTEPSGIHLEETFFTLAIADHYKEFLDFVNTFA